MNLLYYIFIVQVLADEHCDSNIRSSSLNTDTADTHPSIEDHCQHPQLYPTTMETMLRENPSFRKPPVVLKETCDARAKVIDKVAYDLKLWVPEGASFVGDSQVSFNINKEYDEDICKHLHLDLICSYIIEVKVNYEVINDFKYEDNKLHLCTHLRIGLNVVSVKYETKYSKDGTGLHAYVDPADNEHYVYTMFEASNAHKVLPCFDQPNLKGTLTLTVYTRDSAVVMANEPLASRKPIKMEDILNFSPPTVSLTDNKIRWCEWRFYTTSVLSTYLYAWCVGDFAEIRSSGKDGISMSLYSRRSMAKYVVGYFAQEFFNISNRAISYFSEYMNMRYPFSKLDHVIAPEFNCGAMENVGLILYTEQYLYTEKPTRRRVVNYSNTIYHEIAHQWFGNIVTMEWWDDLWLNESFATFMSCVAQRQHVDIYGVDMFQESWLYLLGDMIWGLNKDQQSSTHPIGSNTKDTIAAEAIFDGISYGKGATFLKSWVKYMGADSFKQGVQDYFAIHRNGNTDLSDFISAMNGVIVKSTEKVSNRVPLDKWATTWLSTKGINGVSCDYSIVNSEINLRFTQTFCNNADPVYKSFVMDVIIFFSPDKFEKHEVYVEDKVMTEITIPQTTEVTDITCVYINSGAHAYIKPILSDKQMDFLAQPKVYISLEDTLDRDYLIRQVLIKVEDGEYSPIRYIEFLLQVMDLETNDYIKESVFGKLGSSLSFIPNCLYDEKADSIYKVLRNQYDKCDPSLKPCILEAINSIQPTRFTIKDFFIPVLNDKAFAGDVLKKKTLYKILRNACSSNYMPEDMKDRLVIDILGRNPTDSDTAKYMRQCAASRPIPLNKQEVWHRLIAPPADLSKDEYEDLAVDFAQRGKESLIAPFTTQFFEMLPMMFENHLIGTVFIWSCFPGRAYNEESKYLDQLALVAAASENSILKAQASAMVDLYTRRQRAYGMVKREIGC